MLGEVKATLKPQRLTFVQYLTKSHCDCQSKDQRLASVFLRPFGRAGSCSMKRPNFVVHKFVVELSKVLAEWFYCTFEIPPSPAVNLTTISGCFPSGLIKLVVSLLCKWKSPRTCDLHPSASTKPGVWCPDCTAALYPVSRLHH